MSEELRQPAVIDLETLLQPIPGENPSGEYLRYSGLYDEVAEARREDDALNQGAWQTDLKVADFRRVIELSIPALSSQSKDLQIAVWLTEALIKQYGFVGLRDGLKLLTGLQENFWDTLHPEIEDGDMEGRGNAIAWLDTQGVLAIKKAPYTGSERYSYFDWEDSKKFDFPEDVSGLPGDERAKFEELKMLAETQRRVTTEMWRKEIAATRRIDVEKVSVTISECLDAYTELNRICEEKFDRNQTPGLGSFKRALDDINGQIKELLQVKRAEEPDPELDTPGEESGGEASVDGAPKQAGSATGAIQSRADALKRLGQIAEYFQRNEPHSPVSYLVQRAVKWGNMPLELWLTDVIKDDSVISSLRQTLGFNTGAGESGQ